MMYFGYGSNLHRADLEAWCASQGHDASGIRALGRAWMPDAEVVFHYFSRARGGGALSIRARRGSVVPGVLFEVSPEGWRALDAKEGAPQTYRDVDTIVLTDEGDEVRARTYVVTHAHRRDVHVPPSPRYLALVAEGLFAHALPDAHVRAAAATLEAPAFPRALFVYGTLMRDELRHPLLARHCPHRITNASVRARMLDLGAYPGLVPGRDARVRGELVELDDPREALVELDDVEEFLGYGEARSLYRRVVIEAHLDDGERALAWTYRYVGSIEGARAIESGDWRRR